MSGGIDSSVSATLLKKAGFDVVGIFLKLEGSKRNRCCSLESEKRARLTAKKLDIPFYVLNLEKEFKKTIISYFLNEIKKGNTPNPCVLCNKEIKFGLLIKKALSLGYDFVATGHYARIKNEYLLKGKDREKDQSYFLWRLSKDQLKRVIFPVGNYTKTQVRALAEKFKLPVLDLKESQEICFVNDNFNDYLKEHIKPKQGNILDKKGNVLGNHQGAFFYTIGQRKGINLPNGPYFVLKKQGNDIIVTKQEKDLFQKNLLLKDINLFSKEKVIKAKIRYRAKESEVKIQGNKVIFKKPQRAITPGQSVVFYNGERVLGGGIIK